MQDDDYDPAADALGSWEVAIAALRARHLGVDLMANSQNETPRESSALAFILALLIWGCVSLIAWAENW